MKSEIASGQIGNLSLSRLKDAVEEIRNVTYVNVQNSFQKNISSIENIVLLVSSYAQTICNYKKKKRRKLLRYRFDD